MSMEDIAMARPKKNMIRLTDAEEKQLISILYKSNTCQTLVNRCRILLALDENHPPVRTYDQCMDLFGVSRPTISNVAGIASERRIAVCRIQRWEQLACCSLSMVNTSGE